MRRVRWALELIFVAAISGLAALASVTALIIFAVVSGSAIGAFEIWRKKREGAQTVKSGDPSDAPNITIEDEQWFNLNYQALILEMKVRIRNGPRELQITGYSWEMQGGPFDHLIEVVREVYARQDRLGPLIGNVGPNDDVSFWVVRAFAPRPMGGTPGFTFKIHDGEGNEYCLERDAREKAIKPITALPK